MDFTAAAMNGAKMMGPMMPLIPNTHLSLSGVLMIISGVVYLVCGLFLWKKVKREQNELLSALFAFLMYQAVSMFFMGINWQTGSMTPFYVASLAVFIGSAHMLKFPFSHFSSSVRNVVFYLSIAATIGLFAWFMLDPVRQMAIYNFTFWYDIVVNGLVVGGSILLFGLAAKERTIRMKSLGGGAGVVSCCVVANAAIIGGAVLTSSVFQFLAPVLILGTLALYKNR